MKSTLKRVFGIGSKEQASTDTTTITQEESLEPNENLKQALEEALDGVTASQNQVAELTQKVNSLAQALKAKEDEIALAKIANRTEKLTALVGTAKVGALLEVAKDFDDKTFDAVYASLQTQQAAEEKTALFVEVGVDASVDKAKLKTEEDLVTDYLNNKYKKQGN